MLHILVHVSHALIPPSCRVVRDCAITTILTGEVVKGDLVILVRFSQVIHLDQTCLDLDDIYFLGQLQILVFRPLNHLLAEARPRKPCRSFTMQQH